jgi:hypothetical protein
MKSRITRKLLKRRKLNKKSRRNNKSKKHYRRRTKSYKGGVTPEPEEKLNEPLGSNERQDDDKPTLLPNLDDPYKRMLNVTYKPKISIEQQQRYYYPNSGDALHLPLKKK